MIMATAGATAGRRCTAIALAALALVTSGVVSVRLAHVPPAPTLSTLGIAENPCRPGRVVAVPTNVRGWYVAGSSVLRVAGGIYQAPGVIVPLTPAETACVRASARASRRWLRAGIVPGTSPQMTSMAVRALLDLRLLTRPDGAVVAGWHSIWRYAWPRDSSWVAVALAETGHAADSLRILRFLRRVQLPDGTWAARYWPDGSGPVRDGRPRELDAVGWVPWAVWCWFVAQRPAGAAVRRDLTGLWPMVRAAADAAARSLSPSGLPPASMDYWEDSVEVTLGTAAPLLAGLRAATAIARTVGAQAAAGRWSVAARRLSGGIRSAFGRYGLHRLPYDRSGVDAAVTFLGPPFAPPSPAVGRAALGEAALELPNAGILPGTNWPGNSTVAWTAETAFFALFDASRGHHQQAAATLSWLAAHRTRLGALPEQVGASGQPVSVAPLAWTDAVVLLALLAQARPLPVVPVPPQHSHSPAPALAAARHAA